MLDPFTVLGVTEDADDAEIRRRYLALVREFPPDRAPERFRELRAAYEAVGDERKRLETKVLRTNTAALTRLYMSALQAAATDGLPSDPRAPRATKQAITAVLAEGITKAMPKLSHEDRGKQGGR